MYSMVVGRRVTTGTLLSRSFSRQFSGLKISSEVQNALNESRPVVALESTLIAHGMPYPQNVELMDELHAILVEKGVTPATIAVHQGVPKVGLTRDELESLATCGDAALKCSTRDLPTLLARQPAPEWGATTVASTMRLAHLAGISTFVTGGTGGVHRTYFSDKKGRMDASADLPELARTPVVVVSAGVKSILDIPSTLEYLETLGVPVMAFGQTEFPAFFSPHSGVEAPCTVHSAQEVARAYWHSQNFLKLPSGMLVAVPNSDPAGAAVEDAIQTALRECASASEQATIATSGRDVTPFLLKRVAELTQGASLRSNMALVRNNARVGADIAVAISELQRQQQQKSPSLYPSTSIPSTLETDTPSASLSSSTPLSTSTRSSVDSNNRSRVIVMGGAVVDLVARPDHTLVPATSNPGMCLESDGGVARNVAEVLGRLGSCPILYSAVGSDSRGQALVHRLREECDVLVTNDSVYLVEGARTATYVSILDDTADLHVAICDMAILNNIPLPTQKALAEADMLLLDANPPLSKLVEAASMAVQAGVQVFFEPTSVPKARLVSQNKTFMSCLTYAFPNVDELVAMAAEANHPTCISTNSDETTTRSHHDHDPYRDLKVAAVSVLKQMQPKEAHLIVTMGSEGVLLASKYGSGDNSMSHFSHFPPRTNNVLVENSTGAGDSLCGAFVHALLEGEDIPTAVQVGMDAAVLSLQCANRAISPEIGDW